MSQATTKNEDVKPLMICGHAANGYRLSGGEDVHCCVICGVIEQVNPEDLPDLEGRKAICCTQSTVKPSSFDLAFFEYRGPGSKEATLMCRCGYHKRAHDSGNERVAADCAKKNGGVAGFKPKGPQEYDRYYCGCRGWD